ncbi:transmembrane reductase CYB561D2-like [Haliotis cracherodii]|uniref:transmembrane reductase CYB561D2-like n=1 Tax=Haliotis rufescens TaxID=6454 RepID=UPI00201F5ACE|nr:transmembrane reductase CYB561D2-like [Haliotis rufescens]
MVAHFVALFFTGFIVYTAAPGSSLFSWHPTLMAIAFLLLMFEGLLVFSPISSFVPRQSRATKVTLHWMLQVTSLTCAIGGFAAIYYNKEINNKEHFTSWHGLIGLSAVGYSCMQMLGGSVLKYPALASILRIKLRLADLKIVHATSGLVSFILVCTSFMLAMFSTWFCKNVTGTTWYACLGCISCILFIIMNQITSAYLPKVKSRKRITQ